MKWNSKIGPALGVMGLLAAATLVFFLALGPEKSVDAPEKGEAAPSVKQHAARANKSGFAQLATAKRLKKGKKTSEKVGNDRIRPDFSEAAADSEVALSKAYRALLEELQLASDNNDWRKVAKIVQKMQDSDEWPDGIPVVLHKAAISALKWAGSKCVPEIVGYLGSSDPEVVGDAREAMLDMLTDSSLSDRQRGDLLDKYSRVESDADTLESMLMELDNLRPTVRAETALKILESGNKTATDLLMENLDFYFQSDDYEVKTKEDIERFLKDAEQAYKDDPEKAADDEDFYGGDKDA